jgi:chemotaxis protein histidine kinase CheA
LQTTFANGEKVGNWSEPRESETTAATPAAKKQTAKVEEPPKIEATPEPEETIEETPVKTPLPTPSPTGSPTPPTPLVTATATSTPSMSATQKQPTATPTPRSTSIATATPISTPTQTPIASPTVTPPPPSSLPSPDQPPSNFRLEQGIAAPTRDSLDLALPSPSLPSVSPSAPWSEPASLPSPSAKLENRQRASPTAASTSTPAPLVGSKAQMISQFKKETAAAFAQVKAATDRLREIHQIDAVQALPPEVSANVSALLQQSQDFRAKLGYEVAMYECGAETAVTEALGAVDESTRDLHDKNAPAARMKLIRFFKRYPTPTRDYQRALWSYLDSILASCNSGMKEAERHLDRAKSAEAAGKKEEALREYQEIFRLYPNSMTAEKLQTFEQQSP